MIRYYDHDPRTEEEKEFDRLVELASNIQQKVKKEYPDSKIEISQIIKLIDEYGIDEDYLANLIEEILVIKLEDNKQDNKSLSEYKEIKHKCTCDISTLMRTGCQCGGE